VSFSEDASPSHPDASPAVELIPVVYDELRRLAIHHMSGEAAGNTLQATALVHEAYLRLTKTGEDPRWENRGHFFAAAAEAMRRILIDRARQRNRLKRGGDLARTELHESNIEAPLIDDDLLAVDEALERFATVDPEGADLVKMRYFTGLTLQEVAEVTGISLSTVNRQWAYARAWLKRELEKELPRKS
jgi:RNA polymerase sigma factor (TIGR02999 family)